MKLIPHDPKQGIACFIQFDGCEPEAVNRSELSAAIIACVLTGEPCKTWDASDMQPSAQLWNPGAKNWNHVKRAARDGISPRAERLALEMETCGIHADVYDLPGVESAELDWSDNTDPCVVVNGEWAIFPTITAPFLASPFSYVVTPYHWEGPQPTFRIRSAACAHAVVESFRHKVNIAAGIIPAWSDVPEARGF